MAERRTGVETGKPPGEASDDDRAEQATSTVWTEEAERYYRVLGVWKGSDAAQGVQESARRFWQASGEPGARWLADRLSRERHVEVLHAAAALLGELGPAALGPITERLLTTLAPECAQALLQALGWMGEAYPALTVAEPTFERALASFLDDPDPDTRESAARATRLLPGARATYWLSLQLSDETDHEVSRTIKEELGRQLAARG